MARQKGVFLGRWLRQPGHPAKPLPQALLLLQGFMQPGSPAKPFPPGQGGTLWAGQHGKPRKVRPWGPSLGLGPATPRGWRLMSWHVDHKLHCAATSERWRHHYGLLLYEGQLGVWVGSMACKPCPTTTTEFQRNPSGAFKATPTTRAVQAELALAWKLTRQERDETLSAEQNTLRAAHIEWGRAAAQPTTRPATGSFNEYGSQGPKRSL